MQYGRYWISQPLEQGQRVGGLSILDIALNEYAGIDYEGLYHWSRSSLSRSLADGESAAGTIISDTIDCHQSARSLSTESDVGCCTSFRRSLTICSTRASKSCTVKFVSASRLCAISSKCAIRINPRLIWII